MPGNTGVEVTSYNWLYACNSWEQSDLEIQICEPSVNRIVIKEDAIDLGVDDKRRRRRKKIYNNSVVTSIVLKCHKSSFKLKSPK